MAALGGMPAPVRHLLRLTKHYRAQIESSLGERHASVGHCFGGDWFGARRRGARASCGCSARVGRVRLPGDPNAGAGSRTFRRIELRLGLPSAHNRLKAGGLERVLFRPECGGRLGHRQFLRSFRTVDFRRPGEHAKFHGRRPSRLQLAIAEFESGVWPRNRPRLVGFRRYQHLSGGFRPFCLGQLPRAAEHDGRRDGARRLGLRALQSQPGLRQDRTRLHSQ
jgi:hypothetical protein